MTEKKHEDQIEFDLEETTETVSEVERQRISLKATIDAAGGRALDPQNHDASQARDIALELCKALSESYGDRESARPETLAVAVQTVLETLISSIEREGVNAASMRVALANSMLVNGDAEVKIDVDGKRVPSAISEISKAVH